MHMAVLNKITVLSELYNFDKRGKSLLKFSK